MNNTSTKTSQSNPTEDLNQGLSLIHIRKESSTSSLNTTCSNGTDSSRHFIIPFTQYKNMQACSALNHLNEFGPIQIISKDKKCYISKIQIIAIEDNFSKLYERGKNDLRNYHHFEKTIPEMSFWNQRYYYYSRFDEGIQMDFESWYSVTPESIAKYIAVFTYGKTVIDGFCGSGGNVIQFSDKCRKVYAIDIDQNKIDICKNNCRVYKCKNNIEFILSDFLDMTGKIEADFVFLSPPWGGVTYKNNETYDITKLMTPNIIDIIRVSLSIAKNLIFYLPRNLNLEYLYDLISIIKNETRNGSGDTLSFDVRVLKSNKKLKALMIIFGYDIHSIINEGDLHNYILNNYENVSYDDIKIISMMCNIIGYDSFLSKEHFFRLSHTLDNTIKQLISYTWSFVMDNESKREMKDEYQKYQSKLHIQ